MHATFRLMAAACCLGAAAQPAIAQQASAPKTVAATPASAPAVLPEIRAALERMASAMKAQQSFEFKADVTSEEVLESGQKIQSSSVISASARRPDRLYMEVISDRRNRRLYYDGKTATLYGPVRKFYASVPAPPTTGAMIHELADRYNFETPLLDLFEWGNSGVKLEKVQSSMYAGPDLINGKTCDQYAFRQEGVDWQIWIPKEDPALPCKMVIVDTDDASNPQYSAVFSWVPNAQLGDERFSFTPPADAHRIALGPQAAVPQQKEATK